jgi:integrase
MESHPPLSDLVEKTLQEIDKLGLSTERNRDYRLVYKRFEAFAKTRDEECYSPDLLRSFLADTEQRYRDGVIGRARRNHLRRSALLLKDYLESGRIEWRVYPPETARPMPSSEKFRFLCGQYLESLKSGGKSQNTIESARNQIGQFLVFLDDSGYHTLSEAPLTIVPSFFQHLLARYRPTTMHMVAYNLRTFLKFVEGGERLLPLVPSRCLRSKPIIPVLSDQEYTALKRALEGPEVALRDKAIIQLAFRTGLRSVDIVGMKLSDIDWVNDSILVTQSKTGRPFRIPLTADVGNLLSAYILIERPQVNTPYVFLRFQAPHRPFSGHSSCYGLLRRVFARAGIRVGGERKGFHVLRHSVASRMLSRGVPVTTIASALGHANKASTEVYLATDEGRMRECALPLPELSINIGG